MRVFVFITLVISVVACKKSINEADIYETIFVRTKGNDMPLYLRGNFESGTCILLVHGGPGGSGLEYRSGKFIEAIEKKYGLAYWDQRGQGMSHGTFSSEEVTIENMVVDMKAVINALKDRFEKIQVVALGHSWGGTLTAKFMITNDNQYLLSGWLESNGAHDIPALNIEAVKLFISEANNQINLGNNTEKWSELLSWASAIDTNNISVEQGGEINSKAREAEQLLLDDGIIQAGESGGTKNSIFFGPTNILTSTISGNRTNGNLSEIETLSMTKELSMVTIPCLFLWGKYDFVVPPALGFGAFNTVQSTNKKLVIFDKSGHSPMDNEWEAYLKEVDQFIESL